MGYCGGGDLKYYTALGAWCGPLRLVQVYVLASVLGAVWTVAAKALKGELSDWLVVFFRGLWLRVFCGVRGAVPLGKIDELDKSDGVPFAACLAAASVVLWVRWFLSGTP